MNKEFYGIISFVLIIVATIPYIRDILKGRVKLARATRRLFFVLTLANLYIQVTSFTSWVLALVIAEVLCQSALFGLSFKYGIGGSNKLDKLCYVLFGISLIGYLIFKNPAVSLLLLAVCDFVGFLPTVVKNWRDPHSDTWFFYVVGGVIAPLFSLYAREGYGVAEWLFPAYLMSVNMLAIFPLLYRKKSI